MFAVGAYDSRDCAWSCWSRRIQKALSGNPNATIVVEKTRNNPMAYCTMDVFLDHILQHIPRPEARQIHSARIRLLRKAAISASEEEPGPSGDPEPPDAPEIRHTAEESHNAEEGHNGEESYKAEESGENEELPEPDTSKNAMDSATLDESRAADPQYLIQFIRDRIAAYNASKSDTRAHIQLHEMVENDEVRYGVVDMMFAVGEYTMRKYASEAWRKLGKIPGVGPNLSTCTVNSQAMDFCTFGDFLHYILPHITGKLAEKIRLARSNLATQAMQLQSGAQESQAACQNPMDTVEFDVSRVTNVEYCLQFFQDRINAYNATKTDTRAHIQLRQMKDGTRSVFGIVDMMNAVGEYKSRKYASDVWRKLKSSLSKHSDQKSEGFWLERTVHAQIMDFCTINDFLDNVLPHITGTVAEVIKLARSRTATLVSTGSDMAIALTEHNAERLGEASSSIQATVEEVREEAEEALVQDGLIPKDFKAPPKKSRLYPGMFEVVYENVPPAPMGYRRRSLAHYIEGFDPASEGKLRKGVDKIGILAEFERRISEYGEDGGVLDMLYTTTSYPAAYSAESSQRVLVKSSVISPHHEYYSTAAYATKYEVPDDGEQWKHMLSYFPEQVQDVYIGEVAVAAVNPEGESGVLERFLSTPRKDKPKKYRVTVSFEKLERSEWYPYAAQSQTVTSTEFLIVKEQEETKRIIARQKTDAALAVAREETERATKCAQEQTKREIEIKRQEAASDRLRVLGSLLSDGKITFEQFERMLTSA